jgi:hypothetical protein
MLHVHVVKNIAYYINDRFCLISKNKIFFLPSYPLVSVKSERGNKQYFNLGLK